MYRKNTLKQRLIDGEKVLGCWTMLGHPQVVEILSLAGFDFLLLDQEHAELLANYFKAKGIPAAALTSALKARDPKAFDDIYHA